MQNQVLDSSPEYRSDTVSYEHQYDGMLDITSFNESNFSTCQAGEHSVKDIEESSATLTLYPKKDAGDTFLPSNPHNTYVLNPGSPTSVSGESYNVNNANDDTWSNPMKNNFTSYSNSENREINILQPILFSNTQPGIPEQLINETSSDQNEGIYTQQDTSHLVTWPPCATQPEDTRSSLHVSTISETDTHSQLGHQMHRQHEQTARELLIDRERQSRLERERARLKRHLALCRETDDSSERSSAEDRGNGSFMELEQDNKSVVCTIGDASEILTPVHCGDDDEFNQPHLGYAMERFLSENSVRRVEDYRSNEYLPAQFVIESINHDSIEDSQSLENMSPATVLIINASEQRSLDITSNSSRSCASVASSTLLSDSIVNDDEIYGRDSFVGSHQQSEEQVAPIFDNERILGSVQYGSTSVSVLSHETLISVNQVVNYTNQSDSMRLVASADDLKTEFEDESSSNSRRHNNALVPSDSDTISNMPTEMLHLTEERILHLADIESASVGNMAPRSVRDDNLYNFSEYAATEGYATISNIFSEETGTTAEESVSATSAVSRNSAQMDLDLIPIDNSESNLENHYYVVDTATMWNGDNSSSLVSSTRMFMNRTDHTVEDSHDLLSRSHTSRLLYDNYMTDSIRPSAQEKTDLKCASNQNEAVAPGVNQDARLYPSMVERTKLSRNTLTPDLTILQRLEHEDNLDQNIDGNSSFFVSDSDVSTCKSDRDPVTLSRSPAAPDKAGKSYSPKMKKTSGVSSFEKVQNDLSRCYGTVSDLEESIPLISTNHRDILSHVEPVHRRRESLESIVDSVFSSVRSDSTDDIEADINDSDLYLSNGVLARAFPERFCALLATLVIEIPVLLMISGGSDKLCHLIGRKRYQLLMAFLPLSSAISGNCGLQASTLTTRAISHMHVTKENYLHWMFMELRVAGFLGTVVGFVLASTALIASSFDYAFSITIFIANFSQIFVAGFTGTLAPLIFTFIFHRDSGKWGGPMETAIQDIVGSFAMVILSYRILLLLGPMEIDPNDFCGSQSGMI